MIEYREILGYTATIIGIVGYVPYLVNIFRNKTKPHAFSWLVWSVLTAIAFAAQITENAGPGSWVTGLTAAACFAIFLLALWKGKRTFPRVDWLSLCIAFLSLFLWWITNNPMLSVIFITFIDAVGFLPTFRKGFHKPFEETAITFALSGLKFVPALFALETYSIATWLYPASLVFMNGLFVVMLVVRRNQLQAKTSNSMPFAKTILENILTEKTGLLAGYFGTLFMSIAMATTSGMGAGGSDGKFYPFVVMAHPLLNQIGLLLIAAGFVLQSEKDAPLKMKLLNLSLTCLPFIFLIYRFA